MENRDMSNHSSKLKADTLYIGDNGRCFCGELKCAGMTAHFTGRDLSGQKVLALTSDVLMSDPSALTFKCESCRKESHLVQA
jgi:hypothetical protein